MQCTWPPCLSALTAQCHVSQQRKAERHTGLLLQGEAALEQTAATAAAAATKPVHIQAHVHVHVSAPPSHAPINVQLEDLHEAAELGRIQRLQVHEPQGNTQQQLPKGLTEAEV